MVEALVVLFFILFSVFFGTYAVYFVFVKVSARKPWDFSVDFNFQPKISILIPVHDEENTIASKLKNIKSITYPKENIEVIVADDGSEDGTLQKVIDFSQRNSDLKILIVRQNPHIGKSATLNKALLISTNPIVVVTDADTQWPLDILEKTLPYLSNPSIGAVTGRGANSNDNRSWVVKAEDRYLNLTSIVRLGESKVHSTIRFEGGLCAYRRSAFKKFDCETGADDSGTALEIVQNNYRTILVPEAVFYTQFPTRLSGKLKIKARRANQLIRLWVKCLKFMISRKLILPKRIAIPEILLFILNPVFFLALIADVITLVLFLPFVLFVLVLLIVGLIVFAKHLFFEVLLDNLILSYALLSFLLGKRYVAWRKQ